MKMLKKRPIYLMMLLGALVLSSCNKVLNQEPKTSTYFEKYWKKVEDVDYALSGNYSLLRRALTSGNRYNLYGDGATKTYYTIDYNGDGMENVQNGDYTFKYNLNTYGNYSDFYKVIYQSNLIIKQLEKMSDEVLAAKDGMEPQDYRNWVNGQALFIRAYTYFYMTRIWGDVPLVLDAYDDPITAPQLARTPKAQVWVQVEKDAKEALQLLQWSPSTAFSRGVEATRGAAYALLTHFYLWRATTANLSTVNLADVHSADTAIKAIKNSGMYSLVDTANFIKKFVGKSTESIFEINIDEATLEGSNNIMGMQFLRFPAIENISRSRMFTPQAYLDEHYLWYSTGGDDIRFKKGFIVDGDRPMPLKFSNISYRDPIKRLDAYMSNNLSIFRYTDILLLEAEVAIYEDRYADATAIIEANRVRNGDVTPMDIPTDREWMNYEYLIERGRELYLEGQNVYDAIRINYSYFVPWLIDRRQNEGFYWPVDPRLFKGNKLLLQTPYWMGKI